MTDPSYQRPAGVTDATVAALGKLSEALEIVEDARGSLYRFHRLSGSADLTLQEATRMMRDAGLGDAADEIDSQLVGRNVVSGRWTFELVDDYDQNYWQVFRSFEQRAREAAGGIGKHIFEAEMKRSEQSGQ